MEKISRRRILSSLGLGTAALVGGKAVANVCGGLTPTQTDGPFYPVNDQADKDNDLTMVKGKTVSALGQRVYLKGRVVDEKCSPIPNALVEIWQAAESGKYNHPSDPNPAPLDPNFQYWGRDVSDESGNYSFKTILPGEYEARSDWTRPPHIHMKVHRRGFEEFVTQIYFSGHRLNEGDLVLASLPPGEREKLIVDFQPAEGPEFEEGALIGHFEITLSSF